MKQITKLLAAVICAIGASFSLHAADLTWDHDANGTASDGGGT